MLHVIEAITQHVINVTVDKTKFIVHYLLFNTISFSAHTLRISFRLRRGRVAILKFNMG